MPNRHAFIARRTLPAFLDLEGKGEAFIAVDTARNDPATYRRMREWLPGLPWAVCRD